MVCSAVTIRSIERENEIWTGPRRVLRGIPDRAGWFRVWEKEGLSLVAECFDPFE